MEEQNENSLEGLRASVKRLRKLTDLQCTDGNWNYDSYMHGLANGMIFALSCLDEKEPKYMEAPSEYLKDKNKGLKVGW